VLFIGSTVFTESISAAKYPAYAEYQRTTSMLVPLPPRPANEAPKPA
jgi:steroid 5-alpha reductase family enzyme